MSFQGGNEDLSNVRNDSKYKQQNATIDQTKLQDFKVIYYIQYFGYNLTKILKKINFLRKTHL